MNNLLTGDDFYKRLKNDTILKKAFLFFGDEDYMKLNTKRLLEQKVCPDEAFREMNLFSFDPLDYSPEALTDAFSAAPVFSDDKLVVLGGMNIDAMRESEFSALIEAIEALDLYDGNVFLLNVPSGRLTYTGKESQLKRYKKLCELLLPVKFDKYTPSRLVPWCRRHFQAGGYDVDPELVKRMIAYIGDDMFILSSEIKKLCAYAKANCLNGITFADVENVCVSYEDFGAFDLANAILARNVSHALRILRKKKEQREEPIIILSSLATSVYDMIAVKSMQSAGMSQDDICALLAKKAYPVKLCSDAVRGVDMASLEALLDRVLDVDKKLKSGIGGYSGIEKLICSI